MNSETAGPEPAYRPFNRVLPGLIFLTTVFLLNFISRVIFAPFLPVIERDLGLSHTDSGSFFLLISIGYCLSILCSGFVSSRISHKGTIVLSTVISGCMLCLMSFCTTVPTLRLSVFGLGLSAGLYLPSGLATITRVVSPAYWARGVSIHELAPNGGFVLVPFLSAVMLVRFSWSHSFLLIGIILIGAGVAYAVFARVDGGYGIQPNFSHFGSVFRDKEFWMMLALFSLAICSTLGLYTMLPLYLVADRGMDTAHANHLVSVSRISSLIMPLVAGWVGDRCGHRRVVATVLFITGALTIPIGLCSEMVMISFIFLQPMVAVCFFLPVLQSCQVLVAPAVVTSL